MNFRLMISALILGLVSAFAIGSMTSCAHEAHQSATVLPPKDRVNEARQMQKPYVVLVSIDGYRYDYTEKYNPPNIKALAEAGVQAKSLKPSFPTLTFPNHYTIATGLLPENHGIVGNFFYDKNRQDSYAMNDGKKVYDGTWYSGTPLWRAASKNGMLSGTMYWVGSDAVIDGGKADYVQPWNPQLPYPDRVAKVIDWLSLPEEKRPHFITLYFSAVDSAGHANSPDSTQVRDAIMEVDQVIGRLREFAKQQQPAINIVVVSDHGMRALEETKFIKLHELVDLSAFKTAERGAITQLYSEDQKLIQSTLQKLKKIPHLKAYLRQQVPKKYHYQNNIRIGDIFVVADAPYYIATSAKSGSELGKAKGSSGGTHGWDNDDSEMHGIFYAEGPNFQQKMVIPTFQNIHIYSALLEVLQLPLEKNDGDLKVLKDILVRSN